LLILPLSRWRGFSSLVNAHSEPEYQTKSGLQIPAVAAKIDATAGGFDVSGQFSPGVVQIPAGWSADRLFRTQIVGKLDHRGENAGVPLTQAAREGKSDLSLVWPSAPRCCTSRQNPPMAIILK
jgi:hypothetical protein